MNNNRKESKNIEKELEIYFQAAEPSTNFVKGLEVKLQNAQHQDQALHRMPKRSIGFRRVLAPVMGILLLMITIVIIIGPKQVLAKAQALFGYVPGYGFVDVSDTRVLLTPVSQTQQGVTVTVKQVLSNQDGTYVVLSVDGLPSEDEIYADIRTSIGEAGQDWSTGEPEIWQTQASLTLADGNVLEDNSFGGAPWEGFYIFPALPKSVLKLTFATDRIPGILPEKAPHNWSFDLQLGYISSSQDAPALEDYIPGTAAMSKLLSTPIPMNISSTPDPRFGFSLELVDVIYAETETALRIRFNDLPNCGMAHPCYFTGQLMDDLGNSYAIIYGPSSGFQVDGTYMVSFRPVSPEASALTFSATEIGLNIPIEPKSIQVNFGNLPQVGDSFSIDQTITVMGIPVTFNEVRILQQESDLVEKILLNMFEFEIAPVQGQKGASITGVEFSQKTMENFYKNFSGGEGIQVAQGGIGSKIKLSIGIPATYPIPTGQFEFGFDSAQINLTGPLTIAWDLK